MTPLEIVLASVLVAGSIISAVFTVLIKRRKDLDQLANEHTDELAQLANTRKEIIAELRGEMQEMAEKYQAQIADLNAQIAELRGQYQAMRNFQVREVVEGVVSGVLDGLGALE